jgi:hypothetical protein
VSVVLPPAMTRANDGPPARRQLLGPFDYGTAKCGSLRRVPRALEGSRRFVYAKRPFAGPKAVLARGALAGGRLLCPRSAGGADGNPARSLEEAQALLRRARCGPPPLNT